jgi:hypothetical protein
MLIVYSWNRNAIGLYEVSSKSVKRLKPCKSLLRSVKWPLYENNTKFWEELKLLTHQLELSDNPTSKHLVASRKNGQKK